MASRPFRATSRLLAAAACAAALIGAVGAVQAAETGSISGTVKVEGAFDPDGVVVYLNGPVPGTLPSTPVRVGQKGAQFNPSFAAVAEGASIAFSNDEDQEINHNVFSRSPGWERDLGLFPPGQERIETFDKAGRIKIFCSVHRRMRMEVFVAPNVYFAPVSVKAGGSVSYSIAGVPAGTYTLKVFAQNNRLAADDVQVTVKAGASVTADFKLAVRGGSQ